MTWGALPNKRLKLTARGGRGIEVGNSSGLRPPQAAA